MEFDIVNIVTVIGIPGAICFLEFTKWNGLE